MNTSTKKNKIARAATLLLLVLLSAANALAQAPWDGNGTEQSPYCINNIAQLETLAQLVNDGTTYEDQFFLLDADLAYDTLTQNNHTPIGSSYNADWNRPFSGTFDGNNHTISGIRISNSNSNYCQGLFGFCENSTVKNLILTDAKITDGEMVGGIVGKNFGSSIEDCQVANNVTVSGEEYVGGIAGINAGSIKNCQVANNVTVSGEDYIGGIAGSNPGSIKDCQVANNVTVRGFHASIGGIVGWSYGGSSVENCLVANNVIVSGGNNCHYIGGIVGHIDNSSIKDCQVSNYVTVNGFQEVGGIVGYGLSGINSVENCHVANNVTVSGHGYVGGIAGHISNGSSIEDCQVAINITINGSTIVDGSLPNLRRNYYHGCTVGSIDVGTQDGDITENNGAVPGYLLTLGEHITSDAVSFTTPAYGEMPETTYHVAPSNDTITLGYEFAGCEVTYYVNGEAIAGNTFIMPAEDVNVTAVWTDYTIHTAADWELFCDALQDNATYNRFIGDTVRLAADITVTRMAGSSTHDFMGTFDGDGHTLTIAYGSAENPITEDYAAPFRNVENGCVIKNLHVAGTITTANKYAAGIVAQQYGAVTIRNCRSSVTIQSSVEGDGTHGGLVGVKGNSNYANLTIEGCTFDGKIVSIGTTATTDCGGFVGWCSNSGSLTITNSLYAPAADNNAVSNGATFARNWTMPDDANCYYTETMGAAQGKQAHSITPGEGVLMERTGEASGYDISGITSYGTGIMYDSVLYAGNGDEVGLTFSAPEGFSVVSATYTPEGGTATELTFDDGVYTFTMPDANVVINMVTEYLIHNATEWNNFCDALQDNATYNRFIGKTVKLANDISVTRMAGSDYHDFMGTFDGQGHTLTIAYGTADNPLTEEYAAPFRNLENGAVIHSLHVDGHIYTSNKFASGIAGCQWGTVSVSDCRSSVIIHSSKSGDGTHSGIVAVHHGTLTVSGCVFDGRLLTTNGTTLCAGFVGWRYGTCTLSDCLYAPATDVTLAPGETYITNGATFCRNYSGTFDNCYYTETLGTAQGKLVLTNPAVLPIGDPNATYDVSSLTLYGNGIQFGEVFYYDTERNFLRTIAGYGTDDNGWNLIASPVENAITPTAANGFLTDEYDLYRFNQAADLEWENWKDTVYDNYHYDLASCRGYLYASQTETTLVFTGTPYSGTGEVTLTKTDGVNLSGWNLVGNPFADIAYLADGRPFYTMNDDGSEIVGATSTAIGAMEAVFVVAEQDGEPLTFTTEVPAKGRSLNLNLSRANRSGPSTGSGAAVIDRAIIRFGEGHQLPKFQLWGNSTKLYIPQDNGDYAVVNVGRDVARYVSTIPVNFKANEDGQYTLSLGSENVEFDYLHLIDNMTGADVDLLAPEPVEGPASYTFTAKTTDYETRFKLVFSANNEDGPSTGSGTFAFISNGNIIVNGEGVLQIVDVIGRIVWVGDAINRVSTSGMTPGVYVLRLINGNDVKTQKIVID